MIRRRWLLMPFISLLMLCAAAGCRPSISSATKAPEQTPGNYFREHQRASMTTHGRILMDSVEEKDGRIFYRTEDGKRWHVIYSHLADGTYQYSTPERAKALN